MATPQRATRVEQQDLPSAAVRCAPCARCLPPPDGHNQDRTIEMTGPANAVGVEKHDTIDVEEEMREPYVQGTW